MANVYREFLNWKKAKQMPDYSDDYDEFLAWKQWRNARETVEERQARKQALKQEAALAKDLYLRSLEYEGANASQIPKETAQLSFEDVAPSQQSNYYDSVQKETSHIVEVPRPSLVEITQTPLVEVTQPSLVEVPRAQENNY